MFLLLIGYNNYFYFYYYFILLYGWACIDICMLFHFCYELFNLFYYSYLYCLYFISIFNCFHYCHFNITLYFIYYYFGYLMSLRLSMVENVNNIYIIVVLYNYILLFIVLSIYYAKLNIHVSSHFFYLFYSHLSMMLYSICSPCLYFIVH